MPIAKRKSRRHQPELDLVGSPDCPPIFMLWNFRLILESGVLVRFYDQDGTLDRQDAQSVGIPDDAMDFDRAEMQRYLKQQIKELERQPEQGIPLSLLANAQLLAQLVGLNEIEQHILMFVTLIKTEQIVNNLCEMIRIKQHSSLCKMVAKTLNLPLTAIKSALNDKSALLTTGILQLEVHSFGNTFNDCFDFFSQKFSELLLAENAEPTAFFQDIIKQAPAPTLKLEHFSHIQPDLDILLPYLQHCTETDKVGVNILLYGQPGTGKTELSRLLAQQLNVNLHEVSCECDEGDAIDGNARMRAYRLAQRCLANTKNVLLFDEVEDVFNQNPFARHSEQRKGWLNRMLEQNPVPTLWLTNNHKIIDPAFIRRFDLVIEMPIPPQAQRAEFLFKAAGGILAESTAMQLAAHPMLSPAVIDRASKVVQSIQLDADKHDKAKILQRVMQQTLSAQGHNLPFGKGQELGEVYDPALINTEANLSRIIEGLKLQGSGRLCLYGPPGTGKTAFAHYLAKQLAKPLIIKRASDLLSPYIGETEMAVAAAFNQAAKQQAILLIDEVDSFLQDRSKARHSWEISMVNELLTQLEQFDGLFIASTNLMHNLDQAALRRFDLKACFSYLKPAQARQLLQAHCQQLGLAVCESSLQRVASSALLTPGDFHATRRQARFQPFASAHAFVTSLLTDVALKSQAKDQESKGIGFLQ
ncbi:AAA family ATPase [Alishewanella tabrizica]|uniref:ATPase n=1 Tax=Alishewanella tabrizica TaxID=671278 RepID=A0ABQ2WJS4_9ALTE|nr:ATP-binding protein [Alishewanella tabrizica]GGW57304.1 ATPase [Alishewanella tabrizica]